MNDLKSAFSIAALLIAIIIGVATSGFLYYKYDTTKKELTELKSDSDVLAVKEKKDLLEKIETLVELPVDENPTIATITDVEKVKGQAFFENAKNGDRLIIYPNTGRAILYRPEINKIVESSIIDLSELSSLTNTPSIAGIKETTESSISDTEVSNYIEETSKNEKILVSIYNGTNNIPGLASKAESFIKLSNLDDKYNLEIVEKADSKLDYSQTTIVNYGADNSIVNELLSLFEAIESVIQEEEKPPEGQILIIMGEDFENR